MHFGIVVFRWDSWKVHSFIPSLSQNPGEAGFEGLRSREGQVVATLPNAYYRVSITVKSVTTYAISSPFFQFAVSCLMI